MHRKDRFHRVPFLAVLGLGCCLFVRGERPTILSFTTAQGLVSDSGIVSIEQDLQGYLWIATHEGVSRFDGSEFRNYGVASGLQNPPQINSVLVRRNGEIWVALPGARYNPMANVSHLFDLLSHEFIFFHLREDALAQIWALGADGLYIAYAPGRLTTFTPVCLQYRGACVPGRDLGEVLEIGADQSVWVAGVKTGIFHRLRTGGVEKFGEAEGLTGTVLSLMSDREGRLWAGTSDGAYRFVEHPSPGHKSVEPQWGERDGFAGCAVRALRQTRDGHVWAGGRCGLIELSEGRARRYSTADGLSQNVIEAIFEDRDGELWLGTESSGIMRMERNGITAFGAEAGLEQDVIDGVFRGVDGRVVVVSNHEGHLLVRAGNERGFSPVLPALKLQPTDLDVQHWQVVMQDHEGRWWVPDTNAIRVFGTKPGRRGSVQLVQTLGRKEGLPSGRIDCMMEDKKGDVWVGLYKPGESTLLQWVRSKGQFHSWAGASGVTKNSVPVALTETRSGSIWICYRNGELGRYRNGEHTLLSPSEKAMGQTLATIYEDDSGRLWTGRRRSIFYEVEKPDSPHPRLRKIPEVAAPFLRCILSDRDGYLYLGSEAGLIQYDPRSGAVRHFHERDGLPSDVVQSGTRTPDGTLWFGTGRGLVRVRPRPIHAEETPAVWIDAVEVGGSLVPGLSDRGVQQLNGLRIGPHSGSLRIGFHAISFQSDVRFQYRISPLDPDWSTAVAERSVLYPRLGAGQYRFAVRALKAGTSPGPSATVSFRVLPVVWQRGWFIASSLIGFSLLMALAYRYRVTHLLEIERLRMRIAADLHDDLGASLTQIAVVSDQLRDSDYRNGNVTQGLHQIAEVAREMTSALADVVWSIQPERDLNGDLFSRIRRMGNDLCEAHGVEFVLGHSSGEPSVSIDGYMRRHIYLMFKEALRNALRHAHCRRFSVTCTQTKGALHFIFADDGTGFDKVNVSPGEGLKSIRRRAQSIGASLTMDSPASGGTRISIFVPLKQKRVAELRRV